MKNALLFPHLVFLGLFFWLCALSTQPVLPSTALTSPILTIIFLLITIPLTYTITQAIKHQDLVSLYHDNIKLLNLCRSLILVQRGQADPLNKPLTSSKAKAQVLQRKGEINCPCHHYQHQIWREGGGTKPCS